MDTNSGCLSGLGIEDLKETSDSELVDFLKFGTDIDAHIALLGLHSRYQRSIEIFLYYRGASQDLVDDITQETWLGFYVAVRQKKAIIRESISSFLKGIANKKLADLFRASKSREWIADRDSTTPLDLIIEKEMEDLRVARLELLALMPFIPNLLSSNEGVFWLLREVADIPLQTIAARHSSRPGTIYQTIYKARKKVSAYTQTQQFSSHMASLEKEGAAHLWQLFGLGNRMICHVEKLIPDLQNDPLVLGYINFESEKNDIERFPYRRYLRVRVSNSSGEFTPRCMLKYLTSIIYRSK